MGDDPDDWISVGKPLPRIVAVEALNERRIAITWKGGLKATVDITQALPQPVARSIWR